MLFRGFVFTVIYMLFGHFGRFWYLFCLFLGAFSNRFWRPFWVSDFDDFPQSENMHEYFNEAVFNHHLLLFFDVF